MNTTIEAQCSECSASFEVEFWDPQDGAKEHHDCDCGAKLEVTLCMDTRTRLTPAPCSEVGHRWHPCTFPSMNNAVGRFCLECGEQEVS